MMIPQYPSFIDHNTETVKMPSKTYYLDMFNKRIVGQTDGIQALKQAVYLMLGIERYDWEIFSDQYGIEIEDLIGMDLEFVKANLEMRIKDALSIDERIEDLKDFQFETLKDALHCTFTVVTADGAFETGVEINV